MTMEKAALSPFLTKRNSNVHGRAKNKALPIVGQNFLPITSGKKFGSERKKLVE